MIITVYYEFLKDIDNAFVLRNTSVIIYQAL